jgi:curved DNA-binding protein CbpA
MSFRIDRGLFTSEFTDYHAILGVPVDAELKDIRKRYLKIARRLHPDSLTDATESDRQQASQLLSKLVNPAYEKLSQEKTYAEYCVTLKLKGKQALKQQETIVLTSDPARQLARASYAELSHSYRTILGDLSAQLYSMLDSATELIGQISELNLVYLMRQDDTGMTSRSMGSATPSAAVTAGQKSAATAAKAPPRQPTRSELAAAYLRRSEEYENKQDYARAILELRDALQLEPRNGNLHTRLGVIYLKANQQTMAKIHFNQALKLNPKDAKAAEGIRRVDLQSRQPDAQRSPSKDNKPNKSGGGLFGLFGSKKK